MYVYMYVRTPYIHTICTYSMYGLQYSTFIFNHGPNCPTHLFRSPAPGAGNITGWKQVKSSSNELNLCALLPDQVIHLVIVTRWFEISP